MDGAHFIASLVDPANSSDFAWRTGLVSGRRFQELVFRTANSICARGALDGSEVFVAASAATFALAQLIKVNQRRSIILDKSASAPP